jgi:hypothetical protein
MFFSLLLVFGVLASANANLAPAPVNATRYATRYDGYWDFSGFDFDTGACYTTPLTLPPPTTQRWSYGNNTADTPLTFDTGGFGPDILRLLSDAMGGFQGKFYETTMGNIGYFGYTQAPQGKNTYLKQSSGSSRDGWVLIPATMPVPCATYVGWDLPGDVVKKQCDEDSKCDGFIMAGDNSHGDLCKFSGKGNMSVALG